VEPNKVDVLLRQAQVPEASFFHPSAFAAAVAAEDVVGKVDSCARRKTDHTRYAVSVGAEVEETLRHLFLLLRLVGLTLAGWTLDERDSVGLCWCFHSHS